MKKNDRMLMSNILTEVDSSKTARKHMVVIHVLDGDHAFSIGKAIKKFCNMASVGGDSYMYYSGDEYGDPVRVHGMGHDMRAVSVFVDGEEITDKDIK